MSKLRDKPTSTQAMMKKVANELLADAYSENQANQVKLSSTSNRRCTCVEEVFCKF